MPVTVKQVSNQYNRSIYLLRVILEDPDTEAAQREQAQDAIDDLFLQLGTNAIGRIDGRSALLAALIAELTAVRDSIQLNPVGAALDKLSALITDSRNLYYASKQDLIQEDAVGEPG